MRVIVSDDEITENNLNSECFLLYSMEISQKSSKFAAKIKNETIPRHTGRCL